MTHPLTSISPERTDVMQNVRYVVNNARFDIMPEEDSDGEAIAPSKPNRNVALYV